MKIKNPGVFELEEDESKLKRNLFTVSIDQYNMSKMCYFLNSE